MKLIRWVEEHLTGRRRKRSGSGERKSTSSSKNKTGDPATSSSLMHYPSTQLQLLHRHQQQLQNHNHNGHHHPVYLRQPQQQHLENVLIPCRRHHTDARPHHRMSSTTVRSSSSISQTASYMPWNRSSSHSYSSHAVSMDQEFLSHHRRDPQSHDVYEKEEYLTVFLPSGSSSPSSGSGNDNDHRITDHAISIVRHEDHERDEDGKDGRNGLPSSRHFRNTRRVNGNDSIIRMTKTTTATESVAAEPSPRTRDRNRIRPNPWLRSPWSTPRQSSYSDSSSGSDRSTDSGCSTTGLNDSVLILHPRERITSLNTNGNTFTRPAGYRLSLNGNNNNARPRNLSRNSGATGSIISSSHHRPEHIVIGNNNNPVNNRGASSSSSLMTCQSMSISSVTSGSGNSGCSASKNSVSFCPSSNRSSIYTNNSDEHRLSRESIASSCSSSVCLPPPPDHSYSQLMLEDLLSNLISSRNERIRESSASELTATSSSRSSSSGSGSGKSKGIEDHHPFYRPHRQRREAGNERFDQGRGGMDVHHQDPVRLGKGDNDAGGHDDDDEDDDDDDREDGSREEDFSPSSSSSCHSSGLSSASEIVWTGGRKAIPSSVSPPCFREQEKKKTEINKCTESAGNGEEGRKSIGKDAPAIRRKTWTTMKMRDVTPSRPTNGTNGRGVVTPSPSSPPPAAVLTTPSSNRSSFPLSYDAGNSDAGSEHAMAAMAADCTALSRPTSFCSVLSRGGKDSTPSSISSSCTSGRGLSCSSSSIPAGRRFPYSSLLNKRRFSLIPSSSFCQQRGGGPVRSRIMNEEWVSAATELLCCSDDEVDEEEDVSMSPAAVPHCPLHHQSPDGGRDGAGHSPRRGMEKMLTDEEMRDEGSRKELRSELEDFVTNVFREEMQRLNQY